jgi:uncharacterized protein (DUF1330 family)
MVIIEFPSTEAIQIFWNSPENVAVRELRQDAAVVDI